MCHGMCNSVSVRCNCGSCEGGGGVETSSVGNCGGGSVVELELELELEELEEEDEESTLFSCDGSDMRVSR